MLCCHRQVNTAFASLDNQNHAHQTQDTSVNMPSNGAVKKERGCFQCSRRRIVCDRTEPSCLKCAKKGIECSGLGRIRFVEGVARRGRFKDCRVPKAGGSDGCMELPTTTGFQALRWPGEEGASKRRRCDLDKTTGEPSTLADSQANRGVALSAAPTRIDEDPDADVEDIGRGDDSIVAVRFQPCAITPWIAPIDPKLRMLFSYCKIPPSLS